MIRILKPIFLALIIFVVIYYIDRKIKSHDISFYQGKDGGVSARIESIIFLSFLIFFSYAKRQKIKVSIIGALIGFISSILGFIISYLVFNEYGSTFHIVSFSLVILFFALFKYFKPAL